jgi:hypothetical protein
LPIREIAPRGWLAKQLRLQADSLAGHLDEFWPDVKDSAWIGGSAEGWERMPYWLDGAIPLACLTGTTALQARIARHLDRILTGRHESGWLGPRIEDRREASDLWSQALALKMLIGWHDASGDDRVPQVVEQALAMLDRHIDTRPLSRWGQFRWFEFLIAIEWLYDRAPDAWLLDLAVKLRSQGFDWTTFFRRWPLSTATEKGRWNYAGHVVNNAMALKSGALSWRLTGESRDRTAIFGMMRELDRWHGMPTGVFTGDECLAGVSAVQGTELCAVAEYMYSLECAIGILGDATLADRLERIAFNALPATFSPDMWSHQYVQQLNQIECSERADRCWTTNGPDANVFGLEPNFGCCTANLSQAWPKFVAHLWMRTADGGIAATGYAPSVLRTRVHDVPVTIELATDYPFRTELTFVVTTERPVRFPFFLRRPEWVERATLAVDGAPRDFPDRCGFHGIERTWSGSTTVVLTLPMAPRLLARPRGAVSVSAGPLVFALPIGEDWRRIHADAPLRELPHADWEVHPTTPWNYALVVDELAFATGAVLLEQPLSFPVFAPGQAPIALRVSCRRVDGWVATNGSAGTTPPSPVRTDAPTEPLLLVPYGCTNLRIAEFPAAGGGER